MPRPAQHSAATTVELSHDQKVAIALHDLSAAGLPDLVYADGPNGVRGSKGATAFPSGLAVASSFDRPLALRYGDALARECLAAGRNALLAPGLDIARVPWAGRTGEALGEDPFLVGEIGGPIVEGLQRSGVMAVPKHFVANNFEFLRTGKGSLPRRSDAVDVHISQRALREIYAEPFRRVLTKYGAGAVLSSYNRLNGEYVSESREVLGILRDEWAWEGVIVPDFLFAVRDDMKAMQAGLDLPGLGGAAGRTKDMVQALVGEELDLISGHLLWSLAKANPAVVQDSIEPLNDELSQDLAQEILESGSVLLKNVGNLLPLTPETTSSLALPGIADPAHLLVMGGSAAVTLSPARVTPLAEALRVHFGDMPVRVVGGTLGDVPLPTAEGRVHATVRDDVTGQELELSLDEFALLDPPEGIGPDWSATLLWRFTPPQTGSYRLALTFAGEGELFINEEKVAAGFREASPMFHGPEYPLQAVVTWKGGEEVVIRAEYQTGPAITMPPVVLPGIRLGITGPDQALDDAVDAARAADVAVVVVGRVTGEAMDADSLHLPGDQEALVRAVAAANPRTVVVTCGSGPVVMPWLDDVAAVLHMWNPGERFAQALARLLAGKAEPGGRLPLTFPGSEDLTPVSSPERYPGVDGTVHYDDELLVGYRWYDATGTAPAFAFGHGLGYTEFTSGPLALELISGDLHGSVDVRNIGHREGKVVPQVYVGCPVSAGHPPQMLKAFSAAMVKAGANYRFSFAIPADELAAYDAGSGQSILHPGTYKVSVGLSSRDIHATAEIFIKDSLTAALQTSTSSSTSASSSPRTDGS
ncbi:beta-glucosidase family protein [Pseudarthrobacter sp. NS4]|uniref:beta-glucosidase family protein n=1 Tax=Pseudarthrobacter sp. NS4 TaxID=2973976 RepID=UPI002163E87C|nr:glycoside hydrolase family 3 C-terminal domain-containing protein [Pseudarthrobacter sp. NS4]